MGARNIIALLSIVLLLGVANAQLFGCFCSTLFGVPNGICPVQGGQVNAANSQLISISLIIVLFVLSALGIIYAMGYGFGIESLKTFVKSEVLESVFNLVLIALTASGIAFAGGGIAFFSNIGGIGLQPSPPAVSSAIDVDMAICNNYVVNGVSNLLPDILTTTGTVVALTSMQSFKITLEPDWFGFEVSLFKGLGPVITVVNIELSFLMGVVAILFAVPLLLYFIYYLFPVFFYCGILLRSFPWTRPAGGSFIALFIAFYIVFPALIYPFSTSIASTFTGFGLPLLSSFGFSFSAIAAGNPFTSVFFSSIGLNPLLLEIQGFGSIVSGIAIDLIGLVISLIVSLDFIEVLGDLLGAPALGAGHTKRLLSKVI